MAAPAANQKSVRHKVGDPQLGLEIWGDPDVVKYWFPSASPATKVDPVLRTIAVKGRTRRQYPGDSTPVHQGAHNREVLMGGHIPMNTTPGKAFTCEEKLGSGVLAKVNVSQLSFTGTFKDLYMTAMIAGKAGPWVLRSPGGVAREILEAGGTALANTAAPAPAAPAP